MKASRRPMVIIKTSVPAPAEVADILHVPKKDREWIKRTAFHSMGIYYAARGKKGKAKGRPYAGRGAKAGRVRFRLRKAVRSKATPGRTSRGRKK